MSGKRYLAAMLALLVSLPSLGRANDLTPVELAKARFQSGAERYRAEDWDGAITHYQAAYEALPLPEFLFNLGQAYRMKGDRSRALVYYDRFLATNPKSSAADEARALRDRLATELREAAKPAPVPVVPVVTTPVAVSAPPAKPIYRRWWLWTAVGGVVALGVGLGVGLTLGNRTVDPVGNMGELHP